MRSLDGERAFRRAERALSIDDRGVRRTFDVMRSVALLLFGSLVACSGGAEEGKPIAPLESGVDAVADDDADDVTDASVDLLKYCEPIPQATACAGSACGNVPNGCAGFWNCAPCAAPVSCQLVDGEAGAGPSYEACNGWSGPAEISWEGGSCPAYSPDAGGSCAPGTPCSVQLTGDVDAGVLEGVCVPYK